MDESKLRQYALVGACEHLSQLTVEIADLRATFPGVAQLVTAQDALVAAAASLQSQTFARQTLAFRDRERALAAEPIAQMVARRGPDLAPPVLSKRSRRKKPAARDTNGRPIKPDTNGVSPAPDTDKGDNSAAGRSWATGRELLEVMVDAPPEGLDIAAIAKALRMDRNACAHRVKVRLGKHHLQLADHLRGRYAITPDGRKALELDRDAVSA